ncbi:MAG: hypothetical protein WA783_16425 [Phormidesmis sp.]
MLKAKKRLIAQADKMERAIAAPLWGHVLKHKEALKHKKVLKHEKRSAAALKTTCGMTCEASCLMGNA